jgi:spermidine/putrescine-binding protein
VVVKKLGVSMVVALMLMLSATVYVQAQKGENQVSNYLGFVEQAMMEKYEEAAEILSRQRQQSADTGENQLMEFYLDKLVGAKKNVELHQQDYLLQLEETKEELEEKYLKEFEQQKAEELRNEMGQDVEKYLEEILSEK